VAPSNSQRRQIPGCVGDPVSPAPASLGVAVPNVPRPTTPVRVDADQPGRFAV